MYVCLHMQHICVCTYVRTYVRTVHVGYELLWRNRSACLQRIYQLLKYSLSYVRTYINLMSSHIRMNACERLKALHAVLSTMFLRSWWFPGHGPHNPLVDCLWTLQHGV